MRNVIIAIFVALAGAVLWASFTTPASERNMIDSNKPVIITTTYPLQYMTERVAGNQAEVVGLLPTGVDAHAFSPRPSDLQTLQGADLLIMNGAGLDLWANDLAGNAGLTEEQILVMSEHLQLRDSMEEHEEDEHMREGARDPHFWLDPVLARQMIAEIGERVGSVVSDADVIGQQTDAIRSDFEGLDRSFEHGLAACQNSEIIVAHDAFGYLADRYNIELIPISGISSQDEPSVKELSELVNLAREHDIRHVFFENFTSPRLSETIAREVGAETLVLHPLANRSSQEIEQGRDYLDLMQKNLEQLRIALDCG